MTPQLEEAQRLFRLALRDQETFSLLLPLPRASLAAIGFHAQQAAEKALKAIAVLRGIEFQRTHDLTALASSIQENGGELPVLIDELRRINPFAVEFRYDDELIPLISREELESLLSTIIKHVGLQIEDVRHQF
ncbi:MAG: HEPN domain-containing protein [Sulfuricellaceae bacterium]|nr:HEPN domain-containing protein [Sulfuricellaceae bacterium]